MARMGMPENIQVDNEMSFFGSPYILVLWDH